MYVKSPKNRDNTNNPFVLIFLIYIAYFGKVDWNVKLIASAIFSFGVAMTDTFSKFPLNLNEAHKTMLRVIAYNDTSRSLCRSDRTLKGCVYVNTLPQSKNWFSGAMCSWILRRENET